MVNLLLVVIYLLWAHSLIKTSTGQFLKISGALGILSWSCISRFMLVPLWIIMCLIWTLLKCYGKQHTAHSSGTLEGTSVESGLLSGCLLEKNCDLLGSVATHFQAVLGGLWAPLVGFNP